MSISVPLFNVLAVIALSIFDKEDGNKVPAKTILYRIITNPLIIGVFLGVVVCVIGFLIDKGTGNTGVLKSLFNKTDGTYKFVGVSIDYIGRCATPIALVVLGGRFEFKAVKRLWKQLVVSVSFRLFITPIVMMIIFYYLGYKDATSFAILIALFATPIAVSSAPMAAQMGQDEELAGQIVVWTSAMSAISLFLIILVCSMVGIF